MVDLKALLNKVHCVEVLEGLRQIPDDSIDLIATDCPYGIAMMQKSWDLAVPLIDVWKECLRVLKPGAFAFVMSSPRQDVFARMIVNLQDAGFEIGFTSLYWCFSSGFPKATNIAKAVDRRLGVESEKLGTKYELLGHGKKAKGQLYHRDNNRDWIDNSQAGAHFVTTSTSLQAKALTGGSVKSVSGRKGC